MLDVKPSLYDQAPILEVDGLTKEFHVGRDIFFNRPTATVQAVTGVSFKLYPGETLSLVGESGCGKSTLGRCIIRLLDPTEGKITLAGQDITKAKHGALLKLRKDLQIVFQDPLASLHPRMTIHQILAEYLRLAELPAEVVDMRIKELLALVQLAPEMASRYPHQLSGGQRQRVGIARALSLEPKVIVLDEPVSALDVSVQAGVLNLLKSLQEKLGIAYLFIAHDLSVVRHISDRVAVMYLGGIVEIGPVDEIYNNPKSPYTKALLSAVPEPDPIKERERRKTRIVLEGDLPSPLNPPSGCRFRTRCWRATEDCAKNAPAFRMAAAQHFYACHDPITTL